MKKKISVVVVNWNSGLLTSIAINPYVNYQSEKIVCDIIIVDNASNDNSLSVLDKLPVRLISNKINMGFGYACNQALKKSEADYILLLNPDTESTPETLEGLVEFLEKNVAYAITGPQQKYEDGKIMKSCGRFPSFETAIFDLVGISKVFPKYFKPSPIMLDFDNLTSEDVDQVMGSYMLIRKNVIDITGFMDEDYFVYGEDLDFSKRVSEKGYKSYFNSNYTIIHKGGKSGDKATSQRLFYSISSRRIYWRKHFKKTSLIILTFLSISIEPILRIFGSPQQTFSILKTYWLYIKKLS